MKKSTKIIITLLAVGIVAYFIIKPRLQPNKLEYNFTSISKGNIETLISSTGMLEAINTVEVGTQISGTISKIYVDYNDEVKAGQLLAEMDLRLLNTNLLTSQANLGVSEARLKQAQDDYERNQFLYEENVISEQEFKNSKYAFDQALSNKRSAAASVENIKVNMSYARITSPINGTVTERTVEEGQTVAASFTTPQMFIIAEDLSKMQILADVDESDIGYVQEGMEVRFSVQTYPEKVFNGKVNQIRLQPIKINNVVNYQAVISVDNQEGLLLPGMTANLEFISKTANDVLLINNSALRFRPNEEMLAEIKPVLEERAKRIPSEETRERFLLALQDEEIYTPANFKRNLPAHINGFFFINEDGKLDFQFIEVGISSGLDSEIIRFLNEKPQKEGDKAINSIKSNK